MKKSTVLCLALLFVINRSVHAQATIALDTSTKFQTIEGWGHGGYLFSMMNYWVSIYGIDAATMDSINLSKLDYLTDDLGLTGSRIWEVGPRIDGTGICLLYTSDAADDLL